jgi:hypothetical protein
MTEAGLVELNPHLPLQLLSLDVGRPLRCKKYIQIVY